MLYPHWALNPWPAKVHEREEEDRNNYNGDADSRPHPGLPLLHLLLHDIHGGAGGCQTHNSFPKNLKLKAIFLLDQLIFVLPSLSCVHISQWPVCRHWWCCQPQSPWSQWPHEQCPSPGGSSDPGCCSQGPHYIHLSSSSNSQSTQYSLLVKTKIYYGSGLMTVFSPLLYSDLI